MSKRYSKRTTYKKRSLRKSRSNRRRTQRAGYLDRVSQIRNAASGVNLGPLNGLKSNLSVTGTKAQIHERPGAPPQQSLFSRGLSFVGNNKKTLGALALGAGGLWAANKVKNSVRSRVPNPFLSAGLGGLDND